MKLRAARAHARRNSAAYCAGSSPSSRRNTPSGNCTLRTAAVVLSLVVAASANSALARTPQVTTWTCQTQSVVVAPEAASSKGAFRMTTTLSDTLDSGSFSIADPDASHTASFAARHLCRASCELLVAKYPALELWLPSKQAPTAMPTGQPLTVAVLDTATGKLRASTIIDNAIAALEQGTCERLAP